MPLCVRECVRVCVCVCVCVRERERERECRCVFCGCLFFVFTYMPLKRSKLRRSNCEQKHHTRAFVLSYIYVDIHRKSKLYNDKAAHFVVHRCGPNCVCIYITQPSPPPQTTQLSTFWLSNEWICLVSKTGM